MASSATCHHVSCATWQGSTVTITGTTTGAIDGQRRSTLAVNSGQRRSTVEDHRKPSSNDHRTTAEPSPVIGGGPSVNDRVVSGLVRVGLPRGPLKECTWHGGIIPPYYLLGLERGTSCLRVRDATS
nr:hypothetical protein [Tanacetum cinerariifolium]